MKILMLKLIIIINLLLNNLVYKVRIIRFKINVIIQIVLRDVSILKYQSKNSACRNLLHHIYQINYDHVYCEGKF